MTSTTPPINVEGAPAISFRGGRAASALPILFFIAWAIFQSGVLGISDTAGLIVGMLVGLTLGMFLVRGSCLGPSSLELRSRREFRPKAWDIGDSARMQRQPDASGKCLRLCHALPTINRQQLDAEEGKPCLHLPSNEACQG